MPRLLFKRKLYFIRDALETFGEAVHTYIQFIL